MTEKPRRGSSSRNVKTGASFTHYDESKEDKYSLPKQGKMLMHNRELGAWNDDKDFSDVLGPLKKWVESQVGRNWDTVYSDIRKSFPNNNKQNHHLIDTHLLGYIERDVTVVKSKKGRKVYSRPKYGRDNELHAGDIYVDPDTHVLMRYKQNAWMKNYKESRKPKYTDTGYQMHATIQDKYYERHPSSNEIEEHKFYLKPEIDIRIEWVGNSWVWRKYVKGEVESYIESSHVLSKQELKKYGLSGNKKEE